MQVDGGMKAGARCLTAGWWRPTLQRSGKGQGDSRIGKGGHASNLGASGVDEQQDVEVTGAGETMTFPEEPRSMFAVTARAMSLSA